MDEENAEQTVCRRKTGGDSYYDTVSKPFTYRFNGENGVLRETATMDYNIPIYKSYIFFYSEAVATINLQLGFDTIVYVKK